MHTHVLSSLWAAFAALALLLSLQPASAPAQDFDIQYEETFDVQRKRGGKYKLRGSVEGSRTFLTERATEYHVVSIPEPFYASITDIEGEARGKRLKSRDIVRRAVEQEDIFISGGYVHYLNFPADLAPGDRLSYAYEQDFRDLAYFPLLHVPNADRLSSYRATINHPDDVEVTFEAFFPYGSFDYEVERPSPEQTVLRIENRSQQPSLAYWPYEYTQATFMVTLRTPDGLITPSTPAAFGTWYESLLPAEDSLAAHEHAFIDSLTARAQTDIERVEALYNFARRDVRYIAIESGENAIVPRAPRQVIQRQYGDCKDKAFLIHRYAKALGLDVRMVLLAVQPAARFDGVHAHLFDHVINAVRHEGEWLYFDPTAKYMPFGELPVQDRGRTVLILDGERSAYHVTPPVSPTPSLSIQIDADLAEPAAGRARVVLRGDFYAAAAQVLEEQTGVHFENALSELVNSMLYKMSLDYFKPIDQTDSTLTLEAEADLSSFIIASPTRRYLPRMPFQVIDSAVLERAEDEQPLLAPVQQILNLTIRLHTGEFTAPADTVVMGDASAATFRSVLRPAPSPAPQTTPATEPSRGPHATDPEIVLRTALLSYRFTPHAYRLTGTAKAAYLSFSTQYLESKRNMYVFE